MKRFEHAKLDKYMSNIGRLYTFGIGIWVSWNMINMIYINEPNFKRYIKKKANTF